MIQYPSRIFFSRWEKQNEDNKWLYTSAHTLAIHAKKLFFKNYGLDDWWKKWNIIELHGHQSPTLHFVEYELFGTHPFPKEIRRFVFYPNQKQILELKIVDPYILHQSHLLVPAEGLGASDMLKNPVDRKRWFERCDELYRDFEEHNLIEHPQAHYLSGWNSLLKIKGLDTFNLPDKPNPTRISDWKISAIEIYADISFSDL